MDFLTQDTAWRDTAGALTGPARISYDEKSYFFLTRVSWRVNFLTFVLLTTPGEELEQLYPRHRQEFAPFCKEFVHCGEMRRGGGALRLE